MRGKIVQLVADGKPGGGTTAVLGLCDDLQRAGHDLTLLTDRGSYAAQQAQSLNIDVVELPFFRSRFDLGIILAINKNLRKLKPVLVHAHGARAGLPLSFTSQKSEKRVYTVHGYHFVGKEGISRTFAKSAEIRIARRSNVGIFVSEADRRIALDANIEFSAAHVIYNGITFADIVAEATSISYDLVFSARMHRQKNPGFMIDLMRLLAPHGVKLLMIGGGELEAEVRAEAAKAGLQKHIKFCGALSRPDALRAICKARLFVMPSLWEGLPIAPIEALASGIPVIASDVAGTREVVKDGQTGLLVPGFEGKTWADKILNLLQNPDRIAAMATAGKADAMARFTRERSSAAHMMLYEHLLTVPRFPNEYMLR